MADWRDQSTDKYGIPKQTHPTAVTGAPGSTGAFITSDPLGAPGTTGADFTSGDPTVIPGGFSPIYDTDVYATTDDVTGAGQHQQQLKRPTAKEEENKVREHGDERGAQYSVQRETRNLGQETNIPHVDSSPHRQEELQSRTSGGGGYGVDQEEEETNRPKPDVLEMKTKRRNDSSSQGKDPTTTQARGTGEVYGHHQNPKPTEFSTASCPRESEKYESFPTSFKTSSDPLGTTGAEPTTIPGVGAATYDPVVSGRTNLSQQQQFHHQQQQPQQQFHHQQQQQQPQQQFYHPPAAGVVGYNIGQGGGENPNQTLNRENKTETHGVQHADPNIGQGAARIQVLHTVPGAGVVYGRETITTTANLPPASGGGHMSEQAPPEQWERLEKKGMSERAKEIKDRLLPEGGGGDGGGKNR